MRESQQVIFAGPLGSTILQHIDSPHAPERKIKSDVAAWRAGRRPDNPQSARNTDDLKYRYQDSAILNETNNNEYRADHPPESIEQRRQRTRQWSGVQTPSGRPYVTHVIHRRQRREPVASARVLESDIVRMARIDSQRLAQRVRVNNNAAREHALRAAERLNAIIDAEQHLV